MACCDEKLHETEIKWLNKKSLCVVLCSKGYPEQYKKNVLIKDIAKIKLDSDEYCYHAGTAKNEGKIYAIGGRVLNFVCLSEDFSKARTKIFDLIKLLNWDGGFFRKDIGYKVIDK